MPEAASENDDRVPLGWALVSIAALLCALGFVILWPQLDSDPTSEPGSGHFPLLFGATVASAIAWAHGYRWADIQAGMVRAIGLAMGAILILLVIGVLIGTWLAAGIVPALIDWGLLLMRPSFFLPATCVVCAVISLVSGSSWSTAGTVGLALVGVGDAMDVPAAYTAGAVISGSYFGDKLSPMSDTTNLAPAVAGAELFDHVRHMTITTVPALIVALVGFTVLGLGLDTTASAESILEIRRVIASEFRPSFVHLLVPLVVGVLVVLEFPALPALLGGAALGGILAMVLYGTDALEILRIGMSGFVPHTGNAEVDELLARGGMSSMSDTVLLILCAMIFGGVMERTGQLRAVARAILSLVRSDGSLVGATVLTAFATNVLAADQYISIVLPGRMYAPAFAERGLMAKNLSRALEDGGTITSPLVPWNTCGAYMATTLGISTLTYLPYCFLNIANPVIAILLAALGIGIARRKVSAAARSDAARA
jgi:NhaC family Na+:H+ antiporter